MFVDSFSQVIITHNLTGIKAIVFVKIDMARAFYKGCEEIVKIQTKPTQDTKNHLYNTRILTRDSVFHGNFGPHSP